MRPLQGLPQFTGQAGHVHHHHCRIHVLRHRRTQHRSGKQDQPAVFSWPLPIVGCNNGATSKVKCGSRRRRAGQPAAPPPFPTSLCIAAAAHHCNCRLCRYFQRWLPTVAENCRHLKFWLAGSATGRYLSSTHEGCMTNLVIHLPQIKFLAAGQVLSIVRHGSLGDQDNHIGISAKQGILSHTSRSRMRHGKDGAGEIVRMLKCCNFISPPEDLHRAGEMVRVVNSHIPISRPRQTCRAPPACARREILPLHRSSKAATAAATACVLEREGPIVRRNGTASTLRRDPRPSMQQGQHIRVQRD